MRVTRNNLFYLPPEYSAWRNSKVIAVPLGFEKSVTFGTGTRTGPAAIVAASQQVELFDEELWQETQKKVGVATLQPFPAAKSYNALEEQIETIIPKIYGEKKFPLILGGEHSLTPFIIKSLIRSGLKGFSILQFDAHADLRDGYLGQKYSHASAMRRCLDFPDVNLVQIGIRNISNENDELVYWRKNQRRIKTFWAKDKKRWLINNLKKGLKKNVYLTIDVDVFDSSIMPSTGTPEPGGLDWYEVLDVLRPICRQRNIIGADVVELAPIKGLVAPDFLVAKLIYKMIGYISRHA